MLFVICGVCCYCRTELDLTTFVLRMQQDSFAAAKFRAPMHRRQDMSLPERATAGKSQIFPPLRKPSGGRER